jgi:predicted nucleic acid-binding protein
MLVHPRFTIQLNLWARDLLESGTDVVLPEITYYELRRELIRTQNVDSTRWLDAMVETFSYEPITTPAIIRASELWAETRRAGRPTADDKALDVDVILAATAIELQRGGDDVIVATTNVAHLRRFVAANEWTDIRS